MTDSHVKSKTPRRVCAQALPVASCAHTGNRPLLVVSCECCPQVARLSILLCCVAVSQELNNRLAAEISRLRTLLTGDAGGEAAGSPLTQGKDAYELEVPLSPSPSRAPHEPQVGTERWPLAYGIIAGIRVGDSRRGSTWKDPDHPKGDKRH